MRQSRVGAGVHLQGIHLGTLLHFVFFFRLVVFVLVRIVPSSNDILRVLVNVFLEVAKALVRIGVHRTIPQKGFVHIQEGAVVSDRPVLKLIRRRVFVGIIHRTKTR